MHGQNAGTRGVLHCDAAHDSFTQIESDMQDLTNTSAQLTAAAENIRLHRRVVVLTIVSVIVAITAVAVAVAAHHTSSGTPAPAPAVRPTTSQPAARPSETRPPSPRGNRSNSP